MNENDFLGNDYDFIEGVNEAMEQPPCARVKITQAVKGLVEQIKSGL